MNPRALARSFIALIFLSCASPPETEATGGAAAGEECDGEDICTAEAFCDIGELVYGTPKCKDEGICVTVPASCSDDGPPLCGCDGMLYPNACAAAMAGVSTQGAIGCEPPTGEFGCGIEFCDITTEYCQHVTGGGVAWIDQFACRPLSCTGDTAGCDCLDPQSQCGDGSFLVQECTVEESGAVELLCLTG